MPCLYLLACSLWVSPPPAHGTTRGWSLKPTEHRSPTARGKTWDPGSRRLSSKGRELPLALHACSLFTRLCPVVSTTDSSSCAVRPCQLPLPVCNTPASSDCRCLMIQFHSNLGLTQPKLVSQVRSKSSSGSYSYMCLSGKQACLTSILVLHQPQTSLPCCVKVPQVGSQPSGKPPSHCAPVSNSVVF